MILLQRRAHVVATADACTRIIRSGQAKVDDDILTHPGPRLEVVKTYFLFYRLVVLCVRGRV
jgi:hypothetical protein